MRRNVPTMRVVVDGNAAPALAMPAGLDINDAVYHTAHDYPGGVPALAQRMGMSQHSLAHKVGLNNAAHLSPTEMVKLQDSAAAIIRADPNILRVSSFNGGAGAQNAGRMFITLKARGARLPMKQTIEGLRRKLREVAGINVFMRPTQNLQLGGRQSKAQYQYILQSVKADELLARHPYPFSRLARRSLVAVLGAGVPAPPAST